MKISLPAHGHAMPSGRSRFPITVILLIVILLTGVATYALTMKFLMPSPKERLWNWAVEHGHAALNDDFSLKQALLKVPGRLIASNPDIPELVIDVKFRNMQKIYQKRTEALEKGVLIQGSDDFVPGSIRMGDRTAKIKLRLKGDHTDHLEGDKWSFRIHVSGKDHILGMRRFSLQHPKTRGYQGEALFFETLRYMGVLAPRYLLVNVTINGNDVGVMALEEHFSKELLETNGRRDSPIIRFDESLYWEEIASNPAPGGALFDDHRNTYIDTFRSSRIAKSKRLSGEAAAATGLLRAFSEEKLEPSRVFDSERVGCFLAAAQLWGAYHAVRWHNLRFSLNPLNMKLEPIGFDADVQGRKKPGVVIGHDNTLMAALLDDPEIFSAYRKGLEKLANGIIDGSLTGRLQAVEADFLAATQKEFFLLQPFPYKELEERAKYLMSTTDAEHKGYGATPAEKQYPTLIHAYLVQDGAMPYLELANAVPSVVEVLSATWVTKGKSPDIEFHPLSGVVLPIQLPATRAYAQPAINRVQYQALTESAGYELQVVARIQGQKMTQTVTAKPYHAVYNKHPIPVSSVEEQLSQHPFLSLDSENKSLHVQPGRWQVKGSIIVPRGFSLAVSADTSLQFEPHAALIAHGPLQFTGRDDALIQLEGIEDGQGAGTWQGIAVLEAGSPSKWSYVSIRNTTGIDQPGWSLTGGVTFYASDITMDHSYFHGHRGEDALNIVHSRFELSNVDIVDTASDGLDADFSEGRIKGGTYQSIGKAGGGDGIDVSGSVVTVEGAHFRDISDKALSVGEESTMTAKNLVIERVGTAAASKDGSRLDIVDSAIREMQQAGLMAYIKKPEFGGARIEARNLDVAGEAPTARVQTGSIITIDGEVIATEDVEVERLYETVMKPGLRK